MRCKNCKYCYAPYEGEWNTDEECHIFYNSADDIATENRKGEMGCKYTEKQLDKFDKEGR